MSILEELIIKFDGIIKIYVIGEVVVQVLKGVDFEIYLCEYVVLMG